MNLLTIPPRPSLPALRFGDDVEGGSADELKQASRQPSLSYSYFDLSKDLKAGMEGRGYRKVPEKPWGYDSFWQVVKKSWNLMFLSLGCLSGFGAFQALSTQVDYSGHRPETVELYKKLDLGNMRDAEKSQLLFQSTIANAEAFQKLDEPTRKQIEANYQNTVQEIMAVSETTGQQLNVPVSIFFVSLIVGLSCLVALIANLDSRDDESLELIRRTLKMPKALMDRLRERRFEFKPLYINSPESQQLAQALVRVSERVSDMHQEVTRCLDANPDLKQDFLAAYGEIPSPEAFLQGYLWITLELMLSKPEGVPEQPFSKTKNIDELSLVRQMEATLELGAEAGTLVPQLLADDWEELRGLMGMKKRSPEQNARKEQLQMKRFKANAANYGVAMTVSRERLEKAELALKSCLSVMLETAQQKGAEADQRLMALQPERKRLEGEVNSLKQQVSVHQAALLKTKNAIAQHSQRRREAALQKLGGGFSTLETAVDDAAITPESLRLEIQAQQVLTQLNDGNTMAKES